MSQDLIGALERILNRIENANIVAVNQTGHSVEEEFRKLAQREVYDAYSPERYKRTNGVLNSPKMIHSGADGFRVEFQDSGNWTSWATGQHFYALFGLEGGYTKGRPPSNIMREVTSGEFQEDIADEYGGAMAGQGIPIYRK